MSGKGNSDAALTVVTTAAIAVAFLAYIGHRFVYHWQHPLWVTGDQAVYLMTADLILSGKIPYRDFFDFNPPLIMYFNTVPVLLARLFDCPLPLALSMFLAGLHVIVVTWCGSLVARFRTDLPPVLFVPLLWMFAGWTNTLQYDLGEREHIFVVTFLPYFFVRGLRHSGRQLPRIEAWLAGFVAAVGLFMKPHFLVLALLAEIGFYVESRNKSAFRAPELIAVAIFAILYMVLFFLLPDEARRIFFDQSVTLYFAGTGITALSFGNLLFRIPQGFYWMNWAILFALFLQPLNRWILPLSFLTIGGMWCYLVGWQAWTYRQIPMLCFAQMLCAFALALLARLFWTHLKPFSGISMPRHAIAVAASVFAFANICYCLHVLNWNQAYSAYAPVFPLDKIGYEGESPRSDLFDTFFSIIDNSDNDDLVVFMNSGVWPGCPSMVQSNRKSGSRYLYSFLEYIDYAILSNPDKAEKLRALEAKVIENLGRDIEENRPKLIYVADNPMEILERFKFPEKYMSAYTKIGYVDGATVFKRNGETK